MRTLVVLATVLVISIAAVSATLNRREPVPRGAVAENGLPFPREVIPDEVPRGRPGVLIYPVPGARLGLRVYFSKGTGGHEEELALLFSAVRLNSGKVSLAGVVGATGETEIGVAKRFKIHRPYDLILVGTRETHSLRTTDGKLRKVSFRGYAGKDYSLDDLREVLRQEFGRVYPGETIRLTQASTTR